MAQGSSNPTTDLKKIAGTAVSVGAGNKDNGTQRVTLATDQTVVPISDNSGSLTVDAPVATPVYVRLSDGSAAIATLPVSLASVPSHAVTNAGTFAVQVDGAALTALQLLDDTVATDGAAAVTKLLQVGGTDGTNAQILSTNTTGHLNIADGGNSITVDAPATTPVFVRLSTGSAAIDTIPVSAASLPLPTGAATAAKQPALGTAGTASADVITVQGVASMTALKVDGSAVTQPVSGTVTANAGTGSFTVAQATAANLNATVSLAASQTLGTVTTVSTLTNQTQMNGQAISMGTGARDAGTQRVTIATNDSVPVTGTFYQATQPVSIAATVAVSGPLTDTQLRASAVPVSLASLPALATGSNTIGAVNIAASQTLATVTTVSTVTSLTQMNGQAIAMGTGARSAGTQRVTIATDDLVPVSGPLTDTQLRATAVPVSGTVTSNQGTAGAVANSWFTKISDGTNGPVAVKTAITEPAFGTDAALVVQTRDPVRIRPSETYRDPVDKMRVSMGQSLIDTDFEYGIQPTKWESLTLLNNRATAFYDVTQVAPGTINSTVVTISAITASAKVVTVTGTNLSTVFSVGQPIFTTGTLDTANVDGWWIVDTVNATTLTFLCNNTPATPLYDAGKTYIYPGTFFTGANIPLATSTTIAATVATADTVGNFTCGATASLAIGNPVYVTGTNVGSGSISGYATGNVYYIIATNGSTTFQLSTTPGGAGVTTVAGTLTGLIFSMNAVTVTGTTVIVRTVNDHGLRVGNGVYLTGTTGVTGGPVNGTWSVLATPTNNVFTYTTNASATGAITAAATTTLYPRQPGYIEHRPYDGGVQFSNETAYHGYTDIRQTRRYFRYQSGKGIQFSTGTIMKPPFYVDSLTASGTTVTVTTKYPHGLLVGSTVTVTGATPAAYNVNNVAVTASTALTITYTAGSAPGTSPATGFPINVSPGTWYGGSNRVGMFDQQNGFFFEFDGQTLYAVIRKSTDQISGKVAATLGSQVITGTGSYFADQLKPGDQIVIRGMAYVVQNIQSNTSMTVYPEYRGVTSSNCICTKTSETRTAQANWNIDTVNSGTRSATNPNGFTLDLTKMQMFYADYSWYGAGAVRFGFKDQRGEVIFVHRVVNSNVNYEAYMRSGNLPARYETNTQAQRTYLTATLASATTTGGTITVNDTSLFPSTGTIVLTQPAATGAYSEYITYSAKTATTFTIASRAQTGGVGTAQAFTYSATAPIKVEMYAPQAAQTLSHWGSSVIMDGGYDDDKSLVFNTGQVTLINTPAAGNRYPLLSLRLSPTVDNGITGLLGEREIVNRMQLALRSMGIYTKNVAYRIEVLLNGRVSSGTFAAAGGSSLAQVCNHAGIGTVTAGESMYAFYSNSNDTISQDISQVRDLGTSILGGGTSLTYPTGNAEKYPDGPDIVTVVAIPLESTPSISIASIADTAGNFTCTATTGLAKNQRVIITGTFSNGNITGHSTGAQYYIINTNGRTTFQLSATEGGTAVASTAGTGAGVTVTNSGTGQIAARINWTEAQA